MFSCCVMAQPLDTKDQETRCSADPKPIWDNPEISPATIADQVERQQKAEAKAQKMSWPSIFNCLPCQCRALVDRNSSNALNELPSLDKEVALELGDVVDGGHKDQSTITRPVSASI